MAIESNLAGVVRVAYEAVTGEFNREAEQAARVYASSNEKMSDSAIKLELAQDKLRREIAKGPSASRAQQRALLQLRQAEREVRNETERGTVAHRAYGRELDGNVRRTSRFGGTLRGLRSGVALATGGLLGTTGLVYALSKIKTATDEAEVAEGKLETTLRNQGISFERNRTLIDRRLASLSRMSAFDDEELSESLARATVRTGDLTSALEAQVDIVNIARGRTISLEAATQLWLKASLGQTGQLKRLGIEVDKNATSEELLAQLRRTYAGQALTYARSNASAQDRYNVQLEESAEIIGRALSPALADVTRRAADWLERQNRSGELQRRVNEAVETGGKVLRGLGDGLNIVRAAAEPVVKALGGVENAAKLALIVGIVSRVRRAALSFGLLQTSSATTAAKGVRDATVFGRAWDVATRPRNMVVTTTTTGVPGGVPAPAPGRPGSPTTTTQPRRIPGTTGPRGAGLVGIAGFILIGQVFGAISAPPSLREAQLKVADMSRVDPRRARQLADELSQAFGFALVDLIDRNPLLKSQGRPIGSAVVSPGLRTRPDEGTRIVRRAGNRSTSRSSSRPPRSTDGLSPLQRAQLRFDDATLTPGLSDDLREARALEKIARDKANAEGLKGDKLFAARQELNAARQRTQAIEEQIAQDERDAEEKAEQRRKDRAEKAEARRKRAAAARAKRAKEEQKRKVEEAEQEAMLNAPPDMKRVAEVLGQRYDAMARAYGRDPEAIREADDRRRKAKKKTEPESMTREELGSILRDFLTGWGQMVESYYPNIAGGSTSQSTAVLEHLTREQTGVLRDAVTRPRAAGRSLDEAVFG